jgi:hypothetical protein
MPQEEMDARRSRPSGVSRSLSNQQIHDAVPIHVASGLDALAKAANLGHGIDVLPKHLLRRCAARDEP